MSLLSRDATKHLIDELKEVSPTVVDELIPGVMKISEVQQVLHLLLKEDVPIRQLGIILETLGDFAPAYEGSHLAMRIRASPPGSYDQHSASGRSGKAARSRAGSIDGGSDCGGFGAQRTRLVRPNESIGGRPHLRKNSRRR